MTKLPFYPAKRRNTAGKVARPSGTPTWDPGRTPFLVAKAGLQEIVGAVNGRAILTSPTVSDGQSVRNAVTPLALWL